jgi:hypothetical protein
MHLKPNALPPLVFIALRRVTVRRLWHQNLTWPAGGIRGHDGSRFNAAAKLHLAQVENGRSRRAICRAGRREQAL